MTTILHARPRQFVSTPTVESVATRALRYLQSGFSVHLRGPAGTGKTTLALHLADLLGRPIMLLFGDDEFKTSDLIGNQTGYTRKKVFDNFIHSVVKVEDELRHNWVDSRLTLACREGFTLVYDEFNRSRPEVNNVLLSALEEKLLVLPPNGTRNEYIRVSPHFRAIFTSNPTEYCGVHATQDALLDRLVTINMGEPDELTQQEIVTQKTGISREGASFIVQLVKAFRTEIGAQDSSGLRSCLMLAKVCQEHEIVVVPENAEFRDICQDILLSRAGRPLQESTQILWKLFNGLICPEAVIESSLEIQVPEPESSTVPMDCTAPDGDYSKAPEPDAIAPGLASDLTAAALRPTEEAPEAALDNVQAQALNEIFSDIPVQPQLASGIRISDDVIRDVLAQLNHELLNNAASTIGALVDEATVEQDLVDATAGLSAVTYAPGDMIPEDIGVSVSEIEAVNALDSVALDAIAEPAPREMDASLTDESVPFEHDVYLYLQQFQDARPSQIEAALGISRFQTVNALRALSDKGLLQSLNGIPTALVPSTVIQEG